MVNKKAQYKKLFYLNFDFYFNQMGTFFYKRSFFVLKFGKEKVGLVPEGRSLFWGWHPVTMALAHGKRGIKTIWCAQSSFIDRLFNDAVKQAQVMGAYGRHVDEIRTLCQNIQIHYSGPTLPPGAVHQGVIADLFCLPVPTWHNLKADKGFVLVLDEVVDPHNVGALWRSAAAFGAQAIIVTKAHCPPLDGVTAKAACGAVELVPCIQVPNLVQVLKGLKEKGFFCVGLAEDASCSLAECTLTPVVLVVGAEGKGLRRLTKLACDLITSIPTMPNFSTLNASVSGAIAMYHLHKGGQS